MKSVVATRSFHKLEYAKKRSLKHIYRNIIFLTELTWNTWTSSFIVLVGNCSWIVHDNDANVGRGSLGFPTLSDQVRILRNEKRNYYFTPLKKNWYSNGSRYLAWIDFLFSNFRIEPAGLNNNKCPLIRHLVSKLQVKFNRGGMK